MKWSIFLLKVCDNAKVLLYNTRNSAVVILDEEEYGEVNKVIEKNEKLPKKFNQLLEYSFLIGQDFDEKQDFLEELEDTLKENKHFALHILPTTGCNFNCPYCYQSGIERDFFLNDEVLEQSLKFIKKYLEDKDIEEATLVIHGGEPTVNWAPVIKLLPKMDEIFKDYGIKYRTQIVSNGFNLTSEKADLLAEYNWQRFQVTLDGLPEVHNKRRMLRSGGETFGKIVENIKYVLDKNKIEKVSLRINFDKGNIKEIPKFLEYLSKNFDKDRIVLSLGFISKTLEDTDANAYVVKNGIPEDEIAESYLMLYKKATQEGFEMADLFMFNGICTAKLDNAMVISANGDIYKCLSGVGRDDFIEGNVISKDYNLPSYFFPELYDECLEKECAFLPYCHTGCRFESYLKNGRKDMLSCNREALHHINEALLKYIYLKKN